MYCGRGLKRTDEVVGLVVKQLTTRHRCGTDVTEREMNAFSVVSAVLVQV